MYNLDVNFLNDRGVQTQEVSRSSRSSGSGGPVNWTPAIAGLLVGLLFPAMALIGLAVMKRDGAKIADKEAVVDGELAQLQQQIAELEAIRAEADAIEGDSLALVRVFDRLQPWSAILQDVSNRVPKTVRLSSVVQDDETGTLTLSGNAESYEDVNDFMLKLAASPFFADESVMLGEATLEEDSTQVEVTSEGDNAPDVEIEATDVVGYSIEAPLDEWSYADDEMVSLLSQLGSEGMLARVQALGAEGLLDKLDRQESESDIEQTAPEQEAAQS